MSLDWCSVAAPVVPTRKDRICTLASAISKYACSHSNNIEPQAEHRIRRSSRHLSHALMFTRFLKNQYMRRRWRSSFCWYGICPTRKFPRKDRSWTLQNLLCALRNESQYLSSWRRSPGQRDLHALWPSSSVTRLLLGTPIHSQAPDQSVLFRLWRILFDLSFTQLMQCRKNFTQRCLQIAEVPAVHRKGSLVDHLQKMGLFASVGNISE